MADKRFRGRDKIVQKMTKDGLVEENAEKTESKIAELEEYLRNVRAAQKKEEDNEIVRAIRSTKLGGRDLLALLENIQAGNVTFQTTVNHENKTSEEAEMEDVIAKDA